VGASSVFQRNDSNILFEVACERTGKCNNDQRAFKGVAIRSWARAAQAAPFVSDAIMKMIKASAPVAAKLCTGEHYEDPDMGYVECPFEWSDSNDGDYGLGETHNALQAVTALLWPQAKALVTNNNSTGGSSAGGSTANETKPGASQNTDAPGAASAFSVSSMALFAATVVAVLFL
jgi:mannan endo-1,6-alpha-mannosidase